MKKGKKIFSFFTVLTVLLTLSSVSAFAEEAGVRCFEASQCMTEQNTVNILLVGQDQRPGEPGKRSDSLILCTFCPKAGKLVITSFLRDLYVKIPGYGYERLNAAYALGDRELLKKTLEENFKVRIDGTAEVDFEQFLQIVDIMGGVTLELRKDEAAEINRQVPEYSLQEGLQHLNGQQTLVYSRIRMLDADSDFSRTGRQRKVLTALAEQYRELSFSGMIRLMKEILPAVSTDLSSFELLTYGKQILPMLKEMEIESIRVPDAECCRDETIRGMQVLVPDLPKIQKNLKESLNP